MITEHESGVKKNYATASSFALEKPIGRLSRAGHVNGETGEMRLSGAEVAIHGWDGKKSKLI